MLYIQQVLLFAPLADMYIQLAAVNGRQAGLA